MGGGAVAPAGIARQSAAVGELEPPVVGRVRHDLEAPAVAALPLRREGAGQDGQRKGKGEGKAPPRTAGPIPG